MTGSYPEPMTGGTDLRSATRLVVAEPSLEMVFARELLAQLLPDADPDRLLRALLAERDGVAPALKLERRYDSVEELADRELSRVRALVAAGSAVRGLQHAFSNPLTALLAEVQLLEHEPLPESQRIAVGRILALTRRLVGLSERLGVPNAPR